MRPLQESPHGRVAALLPMPVEKTTTEATFSLSPETEVRHETGATGVAEYLADLLRGPTGFDLPVVEGGSAMDTITLSLSDESVEGGPEGYRLTVTDEWVKIEASHTAGLFRGVQTVRQLLPPAIESDTVQETSWTVAGCVISDYPRFEYRGAHFDVARHFFSVDAVKRFIDRIVPYKINHLHLHLTDNEGWRLRIDSWPELTETGGQTDIDGGEGGYYTKDDYREIVSYAEDRHVTVVPEIDVPAHAGAAVAAYPELGYGDVETSLPAESAALDPTSESTYEFLDDVVREVAELTPGPYIHVGTDEAEVLSNAEYTSFVERVVPIVERHGKTAIGWQEAAGGGVSDSAVLQYWKETDLDLAGFDLLLSPRTHAYLNFRYDEETPPDGPETWGRRIASVETSYRWDPGSHVEGVDESAVLGTESALWSEKLATMNDVDFMSFPRLPGVAERGWSPANATDWTEYRDRLGGHAPRWEACGIAYYRSPEVPWPESAPSGE
ncbi:beta-N-acetylhexosaminidase [Haloarchaeobius sp. TZWSO28]|uniref:beta-N-acetylhexosaminidase n=1 Tax=Haloarchaeobius sp. TZWSO28 TaxID=3446119 RepID=UPI003EB73A06